MSARRITYWLWLGEECLGAVRAPEGRTAVEIRAQALSSHRRVPLSFGTGRTPQEHGNALSRATVRIYPSEWRPVSGDPALLDEELKGFEVS